MSDAPMNRAEAATRILVAMMEHKHLHPAGNNAVERAEDAGKAFIALYEAIAKATKTYG